MMTLMMQHETSSKSDLSQITQNKEKQQLSPKTKAKNEELELNLNQKLAKAFENRRSQEETKANENQPKLRYDSQEAQKYVDFEEESERDHQQIANPTFRPTNNEISEKSITISQNAFDEVEDSFLYLKGSVNVKASQPDRKELTPKGHSVPAGMPAFLAAHIAQKHQSGPELGRNQSA